MEIQTSWKVLMQERLSGVEKNIPWFSADKKKAYDFSVKCGVAVPEIYGTLERPNMLEKMELPERFVCKPLGLSSSNGIMLLEYKKNGIYVNSMSKKEMSLREIISEQEYWFERVKYKKNYGLILEEWIIGEGQNKDEVPYDYKFFCYGDEVAYVSQYNRNTKKTSVNWFFGEFGSQNPEGKIECDWKYLVKGEPYVPSCASELVAAAKKLSKELRTPFVRVDMYATEKGPMFGELTLTPGAAYYGKTYRYSKDFDTYCGLLWQKAKYELLFDGR